MHREDDGEEQGHEGFGAQGAGVEQPSEMLCVAVPVRFVPVMIAVLLHFTMIKLAVIEGHDGQGGV